MSDKSITEQLADGCKLTLDFDKDFDKDLERYGNRVKRTIRERIHTQLVGHTFGNKRVVDHPGNAALEEPQVNEYTDAWAKLPTVRLTVNRNDFRHYAIDNWSWEDFEEQPGCGAETIARLKMAFRRFKINLPDRPSDKIEVCSSVGHYSDCFRQAFMKTFVEGNAPKELTGGGCQIMVRTKIGQKLFVSFFNELLLLVLDETEVELVEYSCDGGPSEDQPELLVRAKYTGAAERVEMVNVAGLCQLLRSFLGCYVTFVFYTPTYYTGLPDG